MKVEIIIERSFLEEILQILNTFNALKNTVIGAVDMRISGAFPHVSKIKLLTLCNERQKDKIIAKIFPIINKYGGACIACKN